MVIGAFPLSREVTASPSLYTQIDLGGNLRFSTHRPSSPVQPSNLVWLQRRRKTNVPYLTGCQRLALPRRTHICPLLFHVKLPAGFSLRGARFEPSLQAGNTKKWFSDGVTLNVREDGSQTQNNPNGARIETEPDGTWECHGFCARPIRGGGSDKYLEMLKAKRQNTLSLCLALRSRAHVAPSCLMLPVSCSYRILLVSFCDLTTGWLKRRKDWQGKKKKMMS